jgi:hypothetical protein
VSNIDFSLQISAMAENPPEGYLFLCPMPGLQPIPGSSQWPDLPAYWSLNPSGLERLSTEEATELGFPVIVLDINLAGMF